jgi:hypothetical protein
VQASGCSTVTTDDSRRDIVAEGFDAGIHCGEYIQKDIGRRSGVPRSPDGNCRFSRLLRSSPSAEGIRDLLHHHCINFRHGSLVDTGGNSRREGSLFQLLSTGRSSSTIWNSSFAGR